MTGDQVIDEKNNNKFCIILFNTYTFITNWCLNIFMYDNNERSWGKRIILFPLMAEILHISRKFEHLIFGNFFF